ncbi:MAG TPA: ATP-binding protein [Terracidiphilus sp.]|nr:ATP-binding protein [Terracidiphilus sp.]
MPNPFEYGTAVTGASFCNRKKEIEDVRRSMDSAERLFLFSERRMGKTSLIMNLRRNLDPKKYAIAYVDLFATESEESFATATAKALANALESRAEHVLAAAKHLFSRFTPSLSLDEAGKPQLTLGMSRTVEMKEGIEEVLRAPAKIAEETSKRVIVVFDEFQRISDYDEGYRVERILRSVIQGQAKVGYIFMGSRKHLIQEMFQSRSRPLYRSAGHYPLGAIDGSHWRPFIAAKFAGTGRKMPQTLVDEICKYTEGHPSYTQQLCHAIWDWVDEGQTVQRSDIERGVKELLQRESYAYTVLWEDLAVNQRRLLMALALENAPVGAFSAAFSAKYALGPPSSIHRAATGLEKREIIERDAKRYFIIDRFFRIWLRLREA